MLHPSGSFGGMPKNLISHPGPSRPWSNQGDSVTSSSNRSDFFKKGALFILLAFAITACVPSTLFAQELSATKGGLGGAITDKSGSAIPNARVTVAGDAD